MPRLQYSERFLDEVAAVYSPKIRRALEKTLDAIELFGDIGSRIVADSIVEAFGSDIRKAPVGPFDLIYSIDDEADIVSIRALIHQKAAR